MMNGYMNFFNIVYLDLLLTVFYLFCSLINIWCIIVSDDSSSVQSSPWQRDHCWKQPNPRPNLGRDLEFYFVRFNRQPIYSYEALKLKRRRPFDLDTIMEPLLVSFCVF